MKENNAGNINIATFLLIIAIVAIIMMGCVIYKLNNKIVELQSVELASVEDMSNELETDTMDEAEDEDEVEDEVENEGELDRKSDYISNFSKTVPIELDEDNTIYIKLSDFDYNDGTGYLSINNKHEAHIYLTTLEGYSNASNLKKIASNVVNAWYCEQGQAPGNNYILFSKEDGSLTYVRFRTANDGKTVFESEEKTIDGITNISDIIPIGGNDANGIGGMGVLLIKDDGSCLQYTTLDDLTK